MTVRRGGVVGYRDSEAAGQGQGQGQVDVHDEEDDGDAARDAQDLVARGIAHDCGHCFSAGR